MKRRATDAGLPERGGTDDSLLEITPLGSGNEVGRSCVLIRYKGKTVLLDCGVHPAYTGLASLPFFDAIDDPSSIDLLLVSHFHLDHAAGLPYFVQKTSFKGRVFMTHPTKAIYKMLLTDFVKVSNVAVDDMLYNEDDINKSMEKIEQIHYHQHMQHNGIKFWCYNAGHVLGAAMFMIEIAGVRILYTGDFSRQEDRHLMEAELPEQNPDVLIVESTYGVQIHEPRKEREARFTKIVHDTVSRGGRCLIPVFALGRAQELLLILDEYWKANPSLKHVPIYFASSLGKKCMTVYQTYIDMMNERLRRQYAVSNPWVFSCIPTSLLLFHFVHSFLCHAIAAFLTPTQSDAPDIKNLKSIDQFHDNGPCVVMASPGMLQSGLSRELFEMWCSDSRNTVVLAGYCVEGTLAKHIMSEPQEVTSLGGRSLPLKMSVHYISFSAHSDFIQTSGFVDQLQPENIVLVHGDRNEMNRLRSALVDKYAEKQIRIVTPRNCQPVTFQFKTEKMCRVLGNLADKYHELAQKTVTEGSASEPSSDPDAKAISGVLVSRDGSAEQTLVELQDLHAVTQLTTTTVQQSMRIPTNGVTFDILRAHLLQVYQNTATIMREDGSKLVNIMGQVTVRQLSPAELSIEWGTSPMSDMIADSVIALLSHCQTNPFAATSAATAAAHASDVAEQLDPKAVAIACEQLGLFLSSQFGNVAVDPEAGTITVTVDSSRATYHYKTKLLECSDEELVTRISSSLVNAIAAVEPIIDSFPRPTVAKSAV